MGKSKKEKREKKDKKREDREDRELEPLPEPIAEHTPQPMPEPVRDPRPEPMAEPKHEPARERVIDLWSAEKRGQVDEPEATPVEREVALLDGLLHVLEDDVQAGNLEAIQTALQISESRRRLLGLETSDLSGAVTVNVSTDTPAAPAPAPDPAAQAEPESAATPAPGPVLVTVLRACDDDLLPSRAALR